MAMTIRYSPKHHERIEMRRGGILTRPRNLRSSEIGAAVDAAVVVEAVDEEAAVVGDPPLWGFCPRFIKTL